VSEGCRNCYAEKFAARFARPKASGAAPKSPAGIYAGFVQLTSAGPRWTGKVELVKSKLEVPLHWRKPRRIFVNSMSDLFHKDVTLTDLERIFRVMFSAPQHTYQILTKRGDVMAARVPIVMNRIFGMHWTMPEFIWLGVSVENQEAADARIPLLLQTPAAVRFVSVEPLLGPVDLQNLPSASGIGRYLDALSNAGVDPGALVPRKLDWVIVGGESGPGARPMHPDWVRSIRGQCVAAAVKFFFKQWGEYAPARLEMIEGAINKTGGKYRFEFDPRCGNDLLHLGKHAAGRVLDGREWNEMPEVSR
jgi:protein gp37